MARVTLEDLGIVEDIIIDVPDRLIEGLVIHKQRVEVLNLTYDIRRRVVLVDTLIHPYVAVPSADGSSFGTHLGVVPGFSARPWSLIADNNTLCSEVDGIPICSAAEEEQELQEVVEVEGEVPRPGKLFGVTYMGQWDYFKRKADQRQVIIDHEIRNFIMYAAFVEGRTQNR